MQKWVALWNPCLQAASIPLFLMHKVYISVKKKKKVVEVKRYNVQIYQRHGQLYVADAFIFKLASLRD